MSLTLREAMAYARTAPAWPVTVADTPDGREFTYARPAGCTDLQAAHMERRLYDHDWLSEPDDLAAGDYLAVPTLWGVELRHPDDADLAGAAS